MDFAAFLKYHIFHSGAERRPVSSRGVRSDCGAPFSCLLAAGNWSMFYFQLFGSRFERGVLGVLGGSVVCIYVLGVVQFAMPVDVPEHISYELAVVGPKSDSSDRTRRTKTLSRPSTSSALAKRVLPTPEIVHRSSFGRPAEVALVGRIKSVGISLQVVSALDLDRKLAELDYSLSDIRRGAAHVPRLQLANLPPDLAQINSANQRKLLFIKSILPLVLRANELILADRRKLLVFAQADRPLTREDDEWIAALADRYDVDRSDMDGLVRRVDVAPPSLAIAQAAEESGWGTSRFAVEANAVFGQWTFRKGSGVVPERRDEGKRHEVRSFEGLRQSVSAYAHNLNIHWAYKEFRQVRHELRTATKAVTGQALVGTLHKYSERGPKYIKTILTIMRVNGLADFDGARLQDVDVAGLGT